MLIGGLCHASIDFGVRGFRVNSRLADGSLTDGSQNTLSPLALEDEIPQNHENRSKAEEPMLPIEFLLNCQRKKALISEKSELRNNLFHFQITP